MRFTTGGRYVWNRNAGIDHYPGYHSHHFRCGKLPEIGGGMGKAIRNFKDASNKAESDAPEEIEEDKKA
jgi:hypothetical protein